MKWLMMLSISCLMGFKARANPDVQNGGFEDYSVAQNDFDFFRSGLWGWETNAPSGKIEIWGSGFLGIESREGIRFSELNTYSLYQDISGVGNGQLWNLEFSHRARVGTDIVNVNVKDLLTGSNLLSRSYSTAMGSWRDYSESLVGTGNPLRLSFTPFPTWGSNSGGNYIDSVRFQSIVPSPASVVILGLGILINRRRR
jgi:hypothetical protein